MLEREWMRFAGSLALIAAATGISLMLRPVLGPSDLLMLYLLSVVITALRWGQAPSVLAAVAGTVLFDYFFIPPLFTFGISDVRYFVILTGLLAVGMITSSLSGQVKKQAEAARRREAYTASLYALSQSLAAASGLDEIGAMLAQRIMETFQHDGVAVLLSKHEELEVICQTPGLVISEEERARAKWLVNQPLDRSPSGRTGPCGEMQFLPLATAFGVIGVLGFRMQPGNDSMSAEQWRLLEAFVSQAALAIEKALLEEKAHHAQLLQETDKLQKALLNSISHDLRTPLASITGALSSLSEDRAILDEETGRELLENAREQASRLNFLVRNLLDMTRLEAGALRLRMEPCDVQDVVGAALAQLGEMARKRKIVVDIPAELPLVSMDFVLIGQVLVNLLDNAIKYSPAQESITVQAGLVDGELQIVVADRGVGIPQHEIWRVFNKSHHGAKIGAKIDSTQGSGLGLSICKGFVEAHGGRIWAESRVDGGMIFALMLPLEAGVATLVR